MGKFEIIDKLNTTDEKFWYYRWAGIAWIRLTGKLTFIDDCIDETYMTDEINKTDWKIRFYR